MVQAGTFKNSGGADYVKCSSSDSSSSFVGSKKGSISSVASIRYSQFFVTRLDPSLGATDLAKDLLKDAEGLSWVRCSKMVTRHPTYSSFHVTVPEEGKRLVSTGDVWPEGSFVKLFFGKLLPSHVLESFVSQSNEYKSYSKESTASTSTQDKLTKKNARIPTASTTGVKKQKAA